MPKLVDFSDTDYSGRLSILAMPNTQNKTSRRIIFMSAHTTTTQSDHELCVEEVCRV